MNYEAIIIALIGSSPTILLALATLVMVVRGNARTQDVQEKVNGQLTALLNTVQALAKATTTTTTIMPDRRVTDKK